MEKSRLGDNARRKRKVESSHWWDMQHSMVLRQTPRWAQALVGGLSMLGVGAIIAGFTVNVDEVVTVQGKLEPSEGSIQVKVPTGGVLGNVYVKEGETVEKGQLIAVFDRRRIEKELATIETQIAQERISKDASIISLKARKRVILRNYETNLSKLKRMKEIYNAGAMSLNAILDQKDRVLDLEANANEIDQQLASVVSRSVGQIADLESRKESAEVQLQYITIKSPEKGVVFQLNASNQGVLGAGDVITQIIPQDGVKAKVWVTNKDIGFVKLGQKADVRVSAFDYTQFGTVEGLVSAIGADVIQPEGTNQQFRFPVTIKLNKNYLQTEELQIPLRTGLAVSANLYLRDRKLITLVSDMFGSQIDSLKSLR